MPSETGGRLRCPGRRRIMPVHDLPLSVVLKPDMGFLKALITYHTFSGAGFDEQSMTCDCGIFARVYLHMHIGQLDRFDSPTLLMKAVHIFSYCGRSSAPAPGFPFSASDVCATQGRTRVRPIRPDTVGVSSLVHFCRLRVAALARQQLLHSSIALIDRLVGVGGSRGIGVRNGNPPEALSCDIARPFPLRPVRVPQRVVFVGISMGPAVNRNRLYIAGRIKTAATQHAHKLVADVSFKSLKGCSEQLVMPRTLLLPRRETWLARSAQHMHQDRLIGRLWRLIFTDLCGLIQVHGGVIHPRTGDAPESKLVKCCPVAEAHN